MNHFACKTYCPHSRLALASMLLIALLGCSGSDVVIESDTSKSSALACNIQPGEDVCARSWTDIAEADRTRAVAALELVSAFAGAARDSLEILDAACGRMLDDGGIARPTTASNADVGVRAKATCNTAAATLRGKSAAMRITIAPPSCTNIPPPSCARPNEAQRPLCSAPAIDVSFVSEEPSDQERLIAESLRRHLGAAMQVKHRLDLLRHLSGELTGVASDLANVCAPTATTLVANAVEELSLAAKLNVELAAALGVN